MVSMMTLLPTREVAGCKLLLGPAQHYYLETGRQVALDKIDSKILVGPRPHWPHHRLSPCYRQCTHQKSSWGLGVVSISDSAVAVAARSIKIPVGLSMLLIFAMIANYFVLHPFPKLPFSF